MKVLDPKRYDEVNKMLKKGYKCHSIDESNTSESVYYTVGKEGGEWSFVFRISGHTNGHGTQSFVNNTLKKVEIQGFNSFARNEMYRFLGDEEEDKIVSVIPIQLKHLEKTWNVEVLRSFIKQEKRVNGSIYEKEMLEVKLSKK